MLSTRDELALSRVLREFCPDVIINGEGPEERCDRSGFLINIPSTSSDEVSISIPAPDQESRWAINREMGFVMVPPRCRLEYRRSRWEWPMPGKDWAFDPPLLGSGEMTAAFPRDDEELKRFGLKLLRLVNKVTWKRTGFGLDACLWSQGGGAERRGLGGGGQFPRDEVVKLNKYYDDSLWDDALPEGAALPEHNPFARKPPTPTA